MSPTGNRLADVVLGIVLPVVMVASAAGSVAWVDWLERRHWVKRGRR
jgi:hypothetical protein